MLKELDTDIWVAQQPLLYLRLSVGTRMTVLYFSFRIKHFTQECKGDTIGIFISADGDHTLIYFSHTT